MGGWVTGGAQRDRVVEKRDGAGSLEVNVRQREKWARGGGAIGVLVQLIEKEVLAPENPRKDPLWSVLGGGGSVDFSGGGRRFEGGGVRVYR